MENERVIYLWLNEFDYVIVLLEKAAENRRSGIPNYGFLC